MALHFKIRKGPARPSRATPVDTAILARPAGTIAFLGADYPGLRPDFCVDQGEEVTAGQVVFRDRRRPSIAFVSPIAGRIAARDYGPRRTLAKMVIERRDNQTRSARPTGNLRADLQENGHWPAFRTRPFGNIPDTDARPTAICVNATGVMAQIVLADRTPDLSVGVEALTQLTDGPVYICQSGTAPLYQGNAGRIETAVFTGRAGADLSGTHIHHLCPVSPSRQVWSINLQDVLAIGVFQRGEGHDGTRLITLTGVRCAHPRLVKSALGANLAELAGDDLQAGSGGVHLFSGTEAVGCEAKYLGRYHDQVTLAAAPGAGTPAWLARITAGRNRALIPMARLERAVAPIRLPVPLMRALSVGDVQAAARLGCLELLEEDIAPLSRLCTSGADYPRLLREVLDTLQDDLA